MGFGEDAAPDGGDGPAAPAAFEPGDIVDIDGKVLGRHNGLVHYTIGQRKGIGIAASEPLYVVGKDAAENVLVVGPRSELGRCALRRKPITANERRLARRLWRAISWWFASMTQ